MNNLTTVVRKLVEELCPVDIKYINMDVLVSEIAPHVATAFDTITIAARDSDFDTTNYDQMLELIEENSLAHPIIDILDLGRPNAFGMGRGEYSDRFSAVQDSLIRMYRLCQQV